MDLKILSNKVNALVKQLDEEQSELLANLRGSRGFLPRMSPAELLTFIIYFHFCRFNDFKAYCHYMQQHHATMFPQQLHYKTLCAWRTRLLAISSAILNMLMQKTANTKEGFIDSTHLDICHHVRSNRKRKALRAARKSKNGMGWHYGFKLHIVANLFSELISACMTAGNVDDRKPVKKMCQGKVRDIYGDRGYISKKLSTRLAKKGMRLITRNRRNMPRNKISSHDKKMLKKRSIIETIIGELKSRYHIDHTRHRSLKGLMVNLWAGLIAYCLSPNKPRLA